MSASETPNRSGAEAIVWEAMLEIYRCALDGGERATAQMDSYLSRDVTIWDHDYEALLLGVEGLDALRARRRPSPRKLRDLVARDEILTRMGEIVVCRLMLDVRYDDDPNELMRVTSIWGLTDGEWKIVHNHEDCFPFAEMSYETFAAAALPTPAGVCAERYGAQRSIYDRFMVGDTVGLDSYLDQAVTVWDAWQEPLFFGHTGLAEMRSRRDPTPVPVTELRMEDPMFTQLGEVIVGRHIATARHADGADERMRCSIVWRQIGDDWKIVHSHEDLLPQNSKEAQNA